MNKQSTIYIIGAVLIIAAFFGGKSYGASHAAPAQQQIPGGFAGGMGRSGANRGGFGGATGQVVSKDATSITVSIPNGGSKIILYSPTTTISKSATGAISDVAVGSLITATGATNADGSVTATNIQIRPASAQGYGAAQPAGSMMPQGGQGSAAPKPAQ